MTAFRTLAVSIGAAVALTGAALAQETIVLGEGDELAVTPVGHASFAMTWNGVTLYNDPAPTGDDAAPTIAAFEALPDPQIVLVSDIHGDHFNADVLAAVAGDAQIVAPPAVASALPDDLKARTTVLANGDKAEVAGISIEAIPMYNITEDRLQFHEKGRGNGYLLSFGNARIYIAGDTEDIPEMRALTDIDVAFLPMNLPYTMSVDQAAAAVQVFQPRVVIPYHYADSDVNAFATAVGGVSEVKILDWYQ